MFPRFGLREWEGSREIRFCRIALPLISGRQAGLPISNPSIVGKLLQLVSISEERCHHRDFDALITIACTHALQWITMDHNVQCTLCIARHYNALQELSFPSGSLPLDGYWVWPFLQFRFQIFTAARWIKHIRWIQFRFEIFTVARWIKHFRWNTDLGNSSLWWAEEEKQDFCQKYPHITQRSTKIV